jgi:mutator protein MutT
MRKMKINWFHKLRQKIMGKFFKASKDYIGAGVGGVILNEKKEVLLQKRGEKAKNEVGCWKLPGGAIEWGETAEEALKREIREELGVVEVEIKKFVYYFDDILVGERQHWVVPFYLCRIKNGEPKNMEPGKIDEIRWFPLTKLPKNLAFGTKEVLSRV